MAAERLQKVLANAGVASRRDCEALIADGRVKVNGAIVRDMGTKVDLDHDRILVDGQQVRAPTERIYIMLNKPTGVVSTADDPQGRQTVVDIINVSERIFPIGRLDANSEGLLLLTNDGDLTHHLTHPRFEVEKEYHALLDRVPDKEALQAWRSGVMLYDKPTAPARVDILEQIDDKAWVRVVLREGRKRQIREVARQLGYEVQRLIRVREGDLVLADLPTGKWRHLNDEEIDSLYSDYLPDDAPAARGNRMATSARERGADSSRRDRRPADSRQRTSDSEQPAPRRNRPVPDRAWREREQEKARQRQNRFSRRNSHSRPERGGGKPSGPQRSSSGKPQRRSPTRDKQGND